MITFGLGKAVTRFGGKAERNMVIADWLRSHAEAPEVFGCPREVYDVLHEEVIKDLFDRSNVVCAVNPDDETQVYGWMCAEPGIVHYVYVKGTYRRQGLAGALIATLSPKPKYFTHNARRHVDKLAAKVGARFNPYLLHQGALK